MPSQSSKRQSVSGKGTRRGLSTRWIAVSFVVLSLLAQNFGLIGAGSGASVALAATQSAAGQLSQPIQADPESPAAAKQRQIKDADKVKSVPIAQEFSGRVPQTNARSAAGVQTPAQGPAAPLPDGTELDGVRKQLNFKPSNAPQIAPHISAAFTYYANSKFDGPITTANCTNPVNSDCTLRSAITLAGSDGHGTTPDLIVLQPLNAGPPYLFTSNNGSLPNIPDYVYLSVNTTITCPATFPELAVINGGSLPITNTNPLLTLGSNDYLNAIVINGSHGEGLQINGSSNKVTCVDVEYSKGSGINIEGAAASNNQIGGINPAASVLTLTEVVVQHNQATVNSGFTSAGIFITGTNAISNTIQGATVISNDVGISLEGATSFNTVLGSMVYGNTYSGIQLLSGSSNNLIGGPSTVQRNLISGNGLSATITNSSSGVLISGSGTVSNTVSGNYIGTNTAGTAALGNGAAGVELLNILGTNTVGGSAAGQGNLVSGNGYGVLMLSASSTIVAGNLVGTDLNGTAAIPNTLDGIGLSANPLTLNPGPSNSNIITGNVVSGNGYGGVSLVDAAPLATGNVVQNNLIGVKADRSGALYNSSSQGDGTGETACNPVNGTPDILSEDCNGVLIASLDAINITGLGPGPTGNSILNNAIAADDSYAQSNNTAFGPNGVLIDYANANTVQGNTIGVVFNGNTAVPLTTNVGMFLLDGASNNQIGGDSTAGQGNLIANSRFNSMQMYEQYFSAGSPTFGPMTGNKVQGNAIGVDFSGTTQPNLGPLGGLGGGVFGIDIEAQIITQTFSSNLFGVDYSAATPNLNQGNLIGNHTIAINLTRANNGGAPGDSNQINGNKLGISADTTASNAGNSTGINISGSLSNTTVRGNFVGAANIAASANAFGIVAVGPITATNITRNYIGTNASGTDLHTGTAIFLGSFSGNAGGANQTSINQNVIAYNQVEGILVGNSGADNQTQRNTISQNSLYANAGKGINLNYTVAAPNGIFRGSDSGPNNQAQAPTITSAFYYFSGTTFKVSGTANPNSTVEVFLGSSIGVTTTQGVTYIGSGNADASGSFAVIASYPGTVPGDAVLVATSTLNDSAFAQRVGSTSQFSPAASIVANPPQLSVAPSAVNFTATAGGSQPASQTVTLTATGGSISYTSTISYGGGASGWLTATPAIGTIISGTNQAVTLAVNTAGLAAGTYNATVTFQDVSNPFDKATVNVTLNVSAAPPAPQLSVAPTSLTFSSIVGGANPASQTVTLTATNGPVTYSTSVSGALSVTVSPASGTVASGTNSPVVISVNSTGLAAGIYTATVTFQDTNNPADKAMVNVTLTVIPTSPPVYTYYLPFLANGYNPGGTITGTFTSYLAVQNAGGGTANATISYFDSAGVTLTSSTVVTSVAQYGEILPANPFASGAKGAGVIVSNQPLNVIVAEGTPFGGSAYAVNQGANSSLIAPLAINNNNNFVTQITVFNGGTVTTTATLTYYDQSGSSPANQVLTIGPRQSATADQTNVTGLATGFYGWAAISSTVGSQLVAQVLEQRPDIKFVAIANAQPAPQTTLYAPAMFNNAYGGFFTGANIVNPGSTPVTVSISYYDLGGTRFAATPFVLVGRGVQQVFQGSGTGNGIPTGGLPAGFVGAAVITATGGGVNMVVNEVKQVLSGSQSGVYAAASSGSSNLGLPVIAYNGFGYTTGTTVFNASPNPATFILAYYKLDGTTLTNPGPRAITVAAYASVGIYQGDDLSNLNGGFYGTAVLTQISRGSTLIDTTNAINSSAGLFYTYTEPAQ